MTTNALIYQVCTNAISAPNFPTVQYKKGILLDICLAQEIISSLWNIGGVCFQFFPKTDPTQS